jgi:hypothetical protein
MTYDFRKRDEKKKIVYPGDDTLVTAEEVQSLLETQNYQCALTGAPLLPPGRGEKWRKFSVDAIVPSLGHCPSNIRIICMCFNAQFSPSNEEREKLGQDRVKHEDGNFITTVRLLRELGILEVGMGPRTEGSSDGKTLGSSDGSTDGSSDGKTLGDHLCVTEKWEFIDI